MSTPIRVVVTGIGATTPLGGDAASTWQSMLAGHSGVVALPEQFHDLPARIAGVAAVDPERVLERVETRRLDRSQQFALIATREAWAHAGAPEIEPERLGVSIASGIGGVTSLLDAYDTLRDRGWSRVSPMAVTMLMPNGPAAVVGLELGARAGVHTPVSACASGAEAIAQGLAMIRNGRADIVVAGGTEAAIHRLPMAAFAAMRALSTRNDDPTTASRPYDVDRDGFVMGEGAGALVLEREDHARARGAAILGEIAGAGITADGHHIAQPEPEGRGAARAMTSALVDAGLSPADICHINAHATSTPAGDGAEALAIHGALGEHARSTIVTATKSMTGHLLGGAGAIETIAVLLALRDRTVPPTINVQTMDPEIDLDIALGAPRSLPEGPLAALNNSFGFGGHNVALVVRSAS